MNFGLESEKTFECNVKIHVYRPGAVSDNPKGPFFINILFLSIYIFIATFPKNDILPIFPIQMHRRPKLTLPYDRSRS